MEFALVFVMFFAIFYGLVTYSLPLLMVQSFNAATTEAVRQSVAISPTVTGYSDAVKSQAQTALIKQLTWLPSALNFNVTSDATIAFNGKLLTVSINYPTSKLTQVMPLLILPGIGTVPSLPPTLNAQASLQLAP